MIGRLGIPPHSNKHRREFRETVGRFPDSYQEVRDAYDADAGAILPGRLEGPTWVDAPSMQMTLSDFTL
jgi:hypothetical protein